MEALVCVIVAGLAGCQITEVIHHGSIFKSLRDWADTAVRQQEVKMASLFGKLIQCPFCLSHWMCSLMVLLLMFVWVSPWFQFTVWIFAATRIANLCNDLAYNYSRSPDREVVVLEEKLEEEDAGSSESENEAGSTSDV